MAGTLDYVRKGEAITAEKWNALVERINALEQRQTFDFRAPRKARGGGGEKLALVAVLGWGGSPSVTSTTWAQDANGVYYTTKARFVDETTLSRGTENITVYMTDVPRADSFRKTYSGSWYNRWAVYRNNRWELLDFQWIDSDTEYQGSDYIGVTNGIITNNGMVGVRTANRGEEHPRVLYFSGFFKAQGATIVDAVGATEITLKTHQETVVTPSGNKTITVLGDS